MELILRSTWRTRAVEPIEFNEDGTVPFGFKVGNVCLPEDYKNFMTEFSPITPLADDNFYLTRYQGSIEIDMLMHMSEMSSVIIQSADLADGVYHGRPKMLPNYIPFGATLGGSVFLNVDQSSPDFGKVFSSEHTQDPWGEGDNIKGLGWVADSFTEFMNSLKDEESLSCCDSFKSGITMGSDSFVDWYFINIIKTKLPEFEQDLGERCCKTFTRNGYLYAKHFGIERADLQSKFVTLMWEIAPNFFTTEAFFTVLNDPKLDQIQKIETIYSLPESASEAAMTNDDPEYWYPALIPNNILGVPYEG